MSNKNKPKDAAAPKVNVLGGVGNALGQNVGAQTDKDDESKVKGHPLKKSHFPSPVVCGVCKKNIWGVGKQGYKCSKCDLTVHKKCIDDLTHECPGADSPPVSRAQSKISGDFTGLAAKSQPALVIDESKLVPTFGSKLDALMGFETIYNPSATMPSVVEKSLHFLMQNGLSVEGIFRIPGGSSKMNAIIEKFNKGQGLQIDFRKEQCSEADVSSVLKKYFRDLPEPLFTNALQAQFQELQAIERYEDRNPRFLELFKQLPKVNQTVAKEFLFFLYQVSTNSHMNMMNTDNLATIFGTMAGVFFSFDHGHDLVMYMIDEYPSLFEHADIAKSKDPLFRRRLVGHLRSVITLIPFEGMMFSFDSNGMVRWWKEQEMKPVSHLNGGAKLFSNPLLVGDWLWAVTPQEVIMWNARTLMEKGNVPDAKKTLPIRGELTGTLVGDNVWLAGEKLLVVDHEGQTVRELTDYTNDMTMCMDKAGKYVWTWRSKVIYVYNPNTFEKVAEIKDVCNSKAIFFASVGSNIWVACDDASILVISENDFSLVSKLTQHKGCVYHIAAVGPVVLSCAWDKTIRIWDPISFSPLGTLDNIHTDAISYLLPRKRPDNDSYELWTASWDRSINVSYIPSAYLSQFRSGLSSSNDQPGSGGPVMVLPPIPLRAPSNPTFVSGQISPGKMPPPPQYMAGPPQGLPPPPQNLPPPPQIGERPVSPTPVGQGVQVLPPLQSSNTVPNLLPRPPVRPKGPMPKSGGDHILKSKSAASVFGEQREQLMANAKVAPGPGLKKAPPALVPRSQTSAGGIKAPSPRSSGQISQLNATLGNLCNDSANIQQQQAALDQEIQEHISALHQEIESMSNGGSSDNWIAMKAKLEDLHQQELDLTNKYAEVSKSLAETRQLIRLAELQQMLEQIETKDKLSETPRY